LAETIRNEFVLKISGSDIWGALLPKYPRHRFEKALV
jgi:hypothetical protein